MRAEPLWPLTVQAGRAEVNAQPCSTTLQSAEASLPTARHEKHAVSQAPQDLNVVLRAVLLLLLEDLIVHARKGFHEAALICSV